MSKKKDKDHIEELKEMIQEKKPKEPVEKVLTKFCGRHGVSMGTCKKYYDQLVTKGEVKEK
jgi:predicted solute-binding protein